MFTGIIESLGTVKSVSKIDKSKLKHNSLVDTILKVNIGRLKEGLKSGQSLSINGTCLTITKLQNNIVEFELIGETIKKTCLYNIKPGDKLNIERSMSMSGRFDGHIVQGHVDCVGAIMKKNNLAHETQILIKIPKQFMELVVSKGSISIDGISLTIVSIKNNSILISLIPHTLKNTTLGIKSKGDMVNIEFDILGKYIKNLLPKN
ncbi:MAG: riboflavin synthase [Nitrososphaeraceae archaeon]